MNLINDLSHYLLTDKIAIVAWYLGLVIFVLMLWMRPNRGE